MKRLPQMDRVLEKGMGECPGWSGGAGQSGWV